MLLGNDRFYSNEWINFILFLNYYFNRDITKEDLNWKNESVLFTMRSESEEVFIANGPNNLLLITFRDPIEKK